VASEKGKAQTQHHFCFAISNKIKIIDIFLDNLGRKSPLDFFAEELKGKSGAGGCKKVTSGAFLMHWNVLEGEHLDEGIVVS